jgi:hypothetical protein
MQEGKGMDRGMTTKMQQIEALEFGLHYSHPFPFFPAFLKYLTCPKGVGPNKLHLPSQLVSLILLVVGKIKKEIRRGGRGED